MLLERMEECKTYWVTACENYQCHVRYQRYSRCHLKCDFQSNQINYSKVYFQSNQIAKIEIDLKSKQIICVSKLKIMCFNCAEWVIVIFLRRKKKIESWTSKSIIFFTTLFTCFPLQMLKIVPFCLRPTAQLSALFWKHFSWKHFLTSPPPPDFSENASYDALYYQSTWMTIWFDMIQHDLTWMKRFDPNYTNDMFLMIWCELYDLPWFDWHGTNDNN
jgi:hypothetical protein